MGKPEVTSKRDSSNPRLIIKLNVIQNWIEPVSGLYHPIKLFLLQTPVKHGLPQYLAVYNPILIPNWSKIKILTLNQNFSHFLVFSPILLESSIEQKFAVLQPFKMNYL